MGLEMKTISKRLRDIYFLLGVLSSGTAYAQPLLLPTAPFDTTPPQIATVSVDGTSDPAGHTCCVIAPPSELEVFLLRGQIVVREINGANAVPWIDFVPMNVDANSEFSGETFGTVAGFSNIRTTISGTIEENAIFAQLTIGADGGLPTGQPLVHNISFLPGLTGEWFPTQYLSLYAEAGVRIDFFEEGDLGSSGWRRQDNGLELFVSMEVNGEEEGDFDWWLLMMTEEGDFFHFDLNTGQFEPGLQSTLQGPLVSTPEPISVMPVVHPPNNSVIVFGVDKEPNNQLDLGLFQGTGYTIWFQ